jgi:hypothetical protein
MISREQWFVACRQFTTLQGTMSQRRFLSSEFCDNALARKTSSFNQALKQYKDGTLQATSAIRNTPGQYLEAEDMLGAFIHAIQQQQQHCNNNNNNESLGGLTVAALQQQASIYTQQLKDESDELLKKYKDFQASVGWVRKVLRRHDLRIGLRF